MDTWICEDMVFCPRMFEGKFNASSYMESWIAQLFSDVSPPACRKSLIDQIISLKGSWASLGGGRLLNIKDRK